MMKKVMAMIENRREDKRFKEDSNKKDSVSLLSSTASKSTLILLLSSLSSYVSTYLGLNLLSIRRLLD